MIQLPSLLSLGGTILLRTCSAGSSGLNFRFGQAAVLAFHGRFLAPLAERGLTD